MRILEGLFGPHSNHLQRSLNQASARQTVVSENLANANTPNYKRKDIRFGIELEQASQRLTRLDQERDTQVVVTRGSLRRDGNSVDMESEVAALAETELRYKLLTEMTSRYFSGLKNVIREGR